MQGRVDLKFRIHGDKQAGTLYFTSIRPKQEGAWRIGELDLVRLRDLTLIVVRYKVITDSNETILLEDKV